MVAGNERRSSMRKHLPDGVKVPEPREPPFSHIAVLEGLRRERRRQARDPKVVGGRRKAVLTMVHNEPVFFPIWLRYYSSFFEAHDIYVLDHDSDDGSTDREGFTRIPVSHPAVDHTWMVRTIQRYQRALLERYDAVLVTDVDEIVAPRPEWGSLADYVDRLEDDFVNCVGYELIHLIDREPPFDPSRMVLDQRGFWFHNFAYNKPAVTTTPGRWRPGFHTREDGRTKVDPDLCLIHLHRMDYEICLARHRYRHDRPWNERDLTENWAKHNLIIDEAEFAHWFYGSNSMNESQITVMPIPTSWRGLF